MKNGALGRGNELGTGVEKHLTEAPRLNSYVAGLEEWASTTYGSSSQHKPAREEKYPRRGDSVGLGGSQKGSCWGKKEKVNTVS